MPGYRLSLLGRMALISIWKSIAAEDRIAASQIVRRFLETFHMLTRQPLIGESRNELKAELRGLTQGRNVNFSGIDHKAMRRSKSSASSMKQGTIAIFSDDWVVRPASSAHC